MRISEINNNTNYTAKLDLKGMTKNISKESVEQFTKKAKDIGTPKDTIEINVLQASRQNTNNGFDFNGVMSRLNFKTSINGEKDTFTLKTPSETNCIEHVLNSLQERFPKK